MPDTLARPPAASLSTLPGAALIRRIRTMLLWAIGTAFVYQGISTASKGGCPGGVTGDGGFIDANGDPTEAASMCVNLTLRPSSIVYVAIAFIVILAITRVLRASDSQSAALKTLDRAIIVIVAVTVAWTALTMLSFFAIPIDSWNGVEPFELPFTVGHVEVDVSPMQ
ncbi:hypothetical protein GE115_10210 [Agromyces sp. CFH 90414]|uniref:Uncharacterized protein n=1 Tax=Agromyces agglutinans TaxID=2662258 RepID=A0A6I2F8Y5_9MICO|nr:hypothetical protein [Agromyces agglutinans]MRG60237.1 hypothetical protein [Agromyces agglutinans]